MTRKNKNLEQEVTDLGTDEAQVDAPKLTKLTKRDIIKNAIEAGGATIKSLREVADCKVASVMSVMSTLRLMGFFPVKDVPVEIEGAEAVEGVTPTELTYRLISKEENDVLVAERAAKAKKPATAKTPEQRAAASQKRVIVCTKASIAAKERLEKDAESVILGLRNDKASVELRIAEYEMAELLVSFPDAFTVAEPTAEIAETVE